MKNATAKMKTVPPRAKLAEAATRAAHAAGKVLLTYFEKTLRVREKTDAGIVSEADFAAEKTAMRLLSRSFPSFGFLTEESGTRESDSPGRWIVDPLDGTTNFVHGFPTFCVSIAAEWDGQIVAGAIYHPILKDTYVAVRGRGATLNGKRLHVSRIRKLEQALLTTGFAYLRGVPLQKEIEIFEQMSQVTRAIRRPGSAALDLAYTARGAFDGFWERGLSAWDVAAGALLVEEAGGKVTRFDGSPFTVDAPDILATNNLLHPAMQARLKK